MNKTKSAVSKLLGNKLFVLLAVGAIAVVVVSAVANNKRMEIADRLEAVDRLHIPTQSDSRSADEEKKETPAKPVPEVVPTPSAERPADVVPPVVAVAPVFQLPLQGELLRKFSVEELLWSETMRDWRTHQGVDISVQDGTEVLAAADGTVTDATCSEQYGNTVVLAHGDGITTVYKNLADLSVSEGQVLERGAVLGHVGNSGAFEIADPPHLHFEMHKNDKPVDPLEQIGTGL